MLEVQRGVDVWVWCGQGHCKVRCMPFCRLFPSCMLTHAPPTLPTTQDACEVLSIYAAAGRLAGVDGAGGDAAVVAAQSFWDYAQQTDRALPGVSFSAACVLPHAATVCKVLVTAAPL